MLHHRSSYPAIKTSFTVAGTTGRTKGGHYFTLRGVVEGAPCVAGLPSGTAVEGCLAVRAESAELRILAASSTARSNPASLKEYLYLERRMLESGVGTGTNGACSASILVK